MITMQSANPFGLSAPLKRPPQPLRFGGPRDEARERWSPQSSGQGFGAPDDGTELSVGGWGDDDDAPVRPQQRSSGGGGPSGQKWHQNPTLRGAGYVVGALLALVGFVNLVDRDNGASSAPATTAVTAAPTTTVDPRDVTASSLLLENQGLQSNNTRLQSDLEVTAEERDHFKSEFERVSSEVSRLTQERDQLRTRVTELERENETLKNDLAAAQETIRDLQSQLTAKEAELQQALSNLALKTEEAAGQVIRINQLEGTIAEQEADLAGLNIQLEEALAEVMVQTRRAETAEQAAAAAEERATQAEAAKTTAEARATEAEQRAAQAASDKAAAEQAAAQARADAQAKAEEAARAEAARAEAAAQAEAAQKAAERAQRAKEELQGRVNNLQQTVTQHNANRAAEEAALRQRAQELDDAIERTASQITPTAGRAPTPPLHASNSAASSGRTLQCPDIGTAARLGNLFAPGSPFSNACQAVQGQLDKPAATPPRGNGGGSWG